LVNSGSAPARRGHIGNLTHPHPTKSFFWLFDLHRDHHDRLRGATAPSSSLFHATNISFINFHLTDQLCAFGAYHRHPVSLQHRPRHAIARTQCAFQGLCRQPVLGAGHVPSRLEPRGQWCSCLVQDRARGNRCLMAASRAHQPAPALSPRCRHCPTRWAAEPTRPAQLLHVGRARLLVGKHLHELAVGARVITPGHESPVYCCIR